MTTLSSIDPNWAWAPFEPSPQQPFDRRKAAHLFRRGGFGATEAQLDAAVQLGPLGAVQQLTQAEETAEEEDTAAHLRAAALAGGDVQRGAAAWLHRMISSNAQAREKMTLFWHGHFATGAEKVNDLQLMQQQNDMFRAHALGDFRSLAQGISKDPAMLIYLDSVTNRRSHPNENYARELMELFCLGEGNYTEHDVLELARCFTGWGVKRRSYKFNPYQYDAGEKSILGETGPFTGEQAVDIVLKQSSLETFITGKLVKFFVMDEPAATPELLRPLGETFRRSNLQLQPVVEQILRSNLFYSEHAIGRKIRSPVELCVNLLRTFDASTNVVALADQLKEIGHGLFFPPNVKGWDGGRAWINTSTLLGRANMVGSLLKNKATRFAGGGLDGLAAKAKVTNSASAASWMSSLLLATPANDDVQTQLATLSQGVGDEPLRRLLHGLAALPQCQLG